MERSSKPENSSPDAPREAPRDAPQEAPRDRLRPPPVRPADPWIVRGWVAGVHGLKGLLRVKLNTDFPERVREADRVWLRGPTGALREYNLVRATEHKQGLLVKLEGVDDRNVADALRGWQLVVRREELPALAEGEHYWHDLLGLRVVTEDGQAVGTIRDILRTGSNDVYVTEGPLIPATAEVVVGVDLDRGEMTIRPMPGLLDP